MSLFCAAPAGAQAPRDNSSVGALERWVERVDTHVPGKLDAAVNAHASLKPSERALLTRIAAPFTFYLQRMTEIPDLPTARLSATEKSIIVNMATRVAARTPAPEWLHRAVIFETDVAILAPELTAIAMQNANDPGLREVIRADDGEAGARSFLNWHWQLARQLVDQRDPQKSDVFAANWYHAVALYLIDQSLFAEVRPHLEAALPLFHEDARIHFDLGCYKDAMGSARVQAVLIGEQSRGFRPSVPTEQSADIQAAAHFRRAIELDGKSAEPRVRLARLLEKSGKPKEALELLAQASPLPQADELEYMAHMIAARANGALGQFADAALHLKAAVQLFPSAQTPLVALSQLSLEAGELDDAVAAASQLRINPNRGDRIDPWWSYFRATWFGTGQLLDALRAQVRR